MYMTYTTIMVDKELKDLLDKIKNDNQSYRELILQITLHYMEENRMQEFVNVAQKKKMKELWDNEYDEIWNKL